MDTSHWMTVMSDEWFQLANLIRSHTIAFVKRTGEHPKVVYLGHMKRDLAEAFRCFSGYTFGPVGGEETMFGMKVLIICNDPDHVGVG